MFRPFRLIEQRVGTTSTCRKPRPAWLSGFCSECSDCSEWFSSVQPFDAFHWHAFRIVEGLLVGVVLQVGKGHRRGNVVSTHRQPGPLDYSLITCIG